MTFNFLKCTPLMTAAFACIAAAASAMALMSQYIFGLEPCILCLYQRYPYGIVIALGTLGFLLSMKKNPLAIWTLPLISITMIANSALAFYHTGVEQKWWKSHLEACSVPSLEGDMTAILEKIQSQTKAVPCDEIPWADPIFGLSMANYNIVFCLGLGAIALLSFILIKGSNTQNPHNTCHAHK